VDQLYVMELTQPIPDVEMLLGKDVLLKCLLIIDGPAVTFTLCD
jgi:hypothetical protein